MSTTAHRCTAITGNMTQWITGSLRGEVAPLGSETTTRSKLALVGDDLISYLLHRLRKGLI